MTERHLQMGPLNDHSNQYFTAGLTKEVVRVILSHEVTEANFLCYYPSGPYRP